MRMIRQYLLAVAAVMVLVQPASADAVKIEEVASLGRHLEAQGVQGVIALYDPKTNIVSVSDIRRARKSHLPASTFKVPGALLALDTGVITDPYGQSLPFDGKPSFVEACNADQTLATALSRSCLWVFARLGRKIGDKQLNSGLKALQYGNARATGKYPYWVSGDLRISALEQIDFIDRLRRRVLPVKPAAMDAVIHILELDRRGDYVLRGKTGWASKPDPDIGWFVGWAEKGPEVRVFAVNINMRGKQDIPVRQTIAKAALAAAGLAP